MLRDCGGVNARVASKFSSSSSEHQSGTPCSLSCKIRCRPPNSNYEFSHPPSDLRQPASGARGEIPTTSAAQCPHFGTDHKIKSANSAKNFPNHGSFSVDWVVAMSAPGQSFLYFLEMSFGWRMRKAASWTAATRILLYILECPNRIVRMLHYGNS